MFLKLAARGNLLINFVVSFFTNCAFLLPRINYYCGGIDINGSHCAGK